MKPRPKYISALLFLIILNSSFYCVLGQDTKNQSGQSSDSIEVAHAVNEFIDAFTNLNWQKFTDCFADDATAFFPPSAKFPFRANNKTEIENIFRTVFENAKKQRSAPPYLVIEPESLKIQAIGKVAIVTFLLRDPDLLGRRSIILKKMNDKWLIVHLHASGVMIPK